jgi:hypothetical protein
MAFIDRLGLFLWPREIPISVTGGSQAQRDTANAAVAKILHTLRTADDGPFQMHNVDLNENPISTQAGERFERIAY